MHNALATLLWSEIAHLADEWHLHRELTIDGLRGIPVPIDSMDAWQRVPVCDELGEKDLVLHKQFCMYVYARIDFLIASSYVFYT